MSAEKLDLGDVDLLDDAADRARRVAGTARRIATTDAEAAGILGDLAVKVEAMGSAALAAARWIEKNR